MDDLKALELSISLGTPAPEVYRLIDGFFNSRGVRPRAVLLNPETFFAMYLGEDLEIFGVPLMLDPKAEEKARILPPAKCYSGGVNEGFARSTEE